MKSFQLYNVKSFKDTNEIELKPISIFVGKNSCGKSSLIRFPIVLSQTYREDVYTPLLLFGNTIDYGSFDDVIHNHCEEDMKFRLTFENSDLIQEQDNFFINDWSFIYSGISKNYYNSLKTIAIEISINKIDKKIEIQNFDLIINNLLVASISRVDDKYRLNLLSSHGNQSFKKMEKEIIIFPKITFDRFIPVIDTYDDKTISEIVDSVLRTMNTDNTWDSNFAKDLKAKQNFSIFGDSKASEKLKSKYKKPIEVTAQKRIELVIYNVRSVTNLLRMISTNVKSFADKVTYIGPFRKNPDRMYRDSENYYNDVGKAGENTNLLLRQAQQSGSELLESVSSWFGKSMGYKINIEEISNSNLFKLVVNDMNNNNENIRGNNIIDVGYGVSQVLPIVTQLYYEDSKSDDRKNYLRAKMKNTFVIEQPELHLHPAAQANLADLFVEKVNRSPNCKLLIETHSEHLIRKLQVLVADPDVSITSNDIAIYYVDKNFNGESTILKMNILENGQFDTVWPSGFFDKSYELSKELLKASNKRSSYET